MKFEIKSWLTGSILFEGDFSCIADAVNAALKARVNLSSANLSFANLSSANLSFANLSSADLSFADLSSADLSFANLSSADLSFAENLSKQTAAELLMCPEEGDFIGWKKCADGVIAKLLVPAKARRSSATTRKCRAEWVKTLALFKDGKPFKGVAHTDSYNGAEYRIGKITRPDKWDDNRWNECSNGIHFFITKQEALNY